MKANNLDNASSERSRVARCIRAVRVTISEHCQSGKVKASNFDSMSSILSHVVQLQVAPRGLRETNAVKVESGKMKVESESEQLRQYEQWKVARSAAAN